MTRPPVISRPSPQPRWVGAVRRQMFFLAVWAAVIVGFAFVALAYWRRGLTIIAVAAIAAGVLRLLLPARQVGWLAVRNRVIDVACFVGFGAGILGLAVSIQG